MTSAISTSSFIDSLGVNTHLDFAAYGYENVGTVENAISYLGLTNIRDSAQNGGDAALWQQVAQATGARFDDYVGETSPSGMQTDLGFVSQLANEGILNYIEGGNEEDDAYPASLGNNLGITAQFQQQVFGLGQQLGLPVINMSFGSGWTADNNWDGNYDKVGDLSGSADYANAHTYANPGQLTDDTINRLNGLALMAAGSRPVITTEIGWDENLGFSQSDVAKYVLDAALDGTKDGDVKTYFYSLFNDASGNFGLMNADGSAKPAGQALHNLTALLQDNGGGASGSLDYSLSTNDNTVLMEKSDGSYWLSVWNENAGDHTATLTLGSAASSITLFDPLTGTSAVQSASDTGSFTFTVPDHPVIVEIGGAASSAGAGDPPSSPASPPPTTGTTTGDVPSTPTTDPTTSGGTAGDASAPNPVVNVPGAQDVAAGSSSVLNGVSISDPWAANNPGTMALNVIASSGAVSMTDANGNAVSGSGTGAIHVSGTLSQLNAELATLSYTSGGDNASVSVDVWDQGGVEATSSIGITAGSGTTSGSTDPSAPSTPPASTGTTSGSTDPSAPSTPPASTGSSDPSTTPPATNGITIAPDDGNVVQLISNTQITASSGDHMIFVGGTGDTVSATGGTESIQAYQGGNTITTGSGDDSIRYAGSNNVIDAGAGSNVLADSGSNNTIVLPDASHGSDDIYGYTMDNGDTFDMRSMLAATSWNGDVSTLGDFVSVGASGTSASIQVDPTGAGGAGYTAATLEGAGPVSLGTLLAHSIT
jgi:serralysin